MARQVTIEFLGNTRDLDNATDAAGRSTSSLGDKLKTVGKVAAVALAAGVALAAKGLYDATKAAAADEAAQQKLALAMKNSAGASDGQIAATEKWISAQGRALGVTDDDLRPALGKLVAATKDVGQAQDLASLAMDASAGSGKSLEAVTKMLVSAQNGNVTALAKLGPSMKNAAGETVSLEEAQRRLGEAFGGAAASKADTLQGKMDRLKLIFDETKETIGAKLLPVVTNLADWFLAKGLPAISAFGGYLQENVLPVLRQVGEWVLTNVLPPLQQFGDFLGTVLPPLFERVKEVIASVFGGETSGQVSDTLNSIKDIVTGVLDVIRTIWERWGENITTILRVVFDAVKGVISGALEVIKGVIKVFSAVLKGDWSAAWDGVKQILRGAWEVIKSIISGYLGVVKELLKVAWGVIKDVARGAWDGVKDLIGNAWEGIKNKVDAAADAVKEKMRAAWNAVKDVARGAWDGIKDIVKAGADKVVDGVKAIPDKLRALGGLFADAARAIIGRFVDGMKNAAGVVSGIAGNVWDAVRSLLNGAISRINAALEFTISLPGPDIHINPPDIPQLAKGGIVTRPTLALIGEDGPEAVVPLSAKHAPRGGIGALAGGDGVIAKFVIPVVVDGRVLQTSLLELKRRNGGLELGLT